MSSFRASAAACCSLLFVSCLDGSSDAPLVGSDHALVAGSVLVNECSSGNAGYIELINVGGAPAELDHDATHCFSVDDIAAGGAAKRLTDANVNHAPGSTTCASAGRPATCALLAPGERVWVSYSYFNSSSDDSCRLLSHPYAAGGASCTTSYAEFDRGGPTHSTTSGQCFGRQPDAGAWQASAIPCTPTAGSNGGGGACALGTPCDDANACTTGETWAAACSCSNGVPVGCDDVNPCTTDACGAATGCSHQALPDGTACSGGTCEAGECVGAVLMPVVINEFLPGSGGWVELYNPRTDPADVGGYVIDDVAAAGGAPVAIAAGTAVPAKGTLVIAYSSINTASTDQVRFAQQSCGGCTAGAGDSTGNFYAGTSLAGRCFGRLYDGGPWDAFSRACTRGGTNGTPPACVPGSACDDANPCTEGSTWSAACTCGGGAAVACGGIANIRVVRTATIASIPVGAPAPGSYRIHLIDVGTGLAILVQGSDFNLLYDGGSTDDSAGISATGNRSRLLSYLRAALGAPADPACKPLGDSWPVVAAAAPEIDHVFLSHPHQDHNNMLDEVLRCYQVGNVWDPGVNPNTASYEAFVAAAAAEPGVVYHTVVPRPASSAVTIRTTTISFLGVADWVTFRAGDVELLGDGATLRVLHTDGTYYANQFNDNSTVLRLELGSTSLLLAGDAEAGLRASELGPLGEIEAALLQNHRPELDVDILQVAHHGSSTSSRKVFLDAVTPRYALLSAGPTLNNGGVSFPDASVIESLRNTGALLLRTDEHDAGCPDADRVGVDDTKPGGCDSYLLELSPP